MCFHTVLTHVHVMPYKHVHCILHMTCIVCLKMKHLRIDLACQSTSTNTHCMFKVGGCQCEGLQMGQSSGVLFKEVSAFRSCPLIEVLPQ